MSRQQKYSFTLEIAFEDVCHQHEMTSSLKDFVSFACSRVVATENIAAAQDIEGEPELPY
jgi:hypothetical protein